MLNLGKRIDTHFPQTTTLGDWGTISANQPYQGSRNRIECASIFFGQNSVSNAWCRHANNNDRDLFSAIITAIGVLGMSDEIKEDNKAEAARKAPVSNVGKIGKSIIASRAKKMIDQFDEFLEEGESFLSVGDADGAVSLEIQRRCGLTGRGLDVDIGMPRNEEIPIDYYDGITMPYEDDAFDVVFVLFTLHHCNDLDAVLKEIVRVAKKKIVIMEDVYETAFGRRVVCFMDKLENRLVSSEITLPFNFKKVLEWEETFKDLDLKITKSKGFKMGWAMPVQNHIFCLQK